MYELYTFIALSQRRPEADKRYTPEAEDRFYRDNALTFRALSFWHALYSIIRRVPNRKSAPDHEDAGSTRQAARPC